MVTANSVGANTASLPHVNFLSRRSALRVRIDPMGFLERLQWRGQRHGQLAFEDQGNLLLGSQAFRRRPRSLPTTGSGHLYRPCDRQHRVARLDRQLSRRGRVLKHGQFRGPNWRRFDQRPRRNELWRHGHFDPRDRLFAGTLTGNIGARTATLAGSFFQGGATNLTPLYGEMGGSINLTGTNYLGSGIFAARKP